MNFEKISLKIIEAIKRLYRNDSYLIDKNVHERAITFRLGMYLQQIFASWNVDCEYNKNIETKLLSSDLQFSFFK